MYRKVSRTWAQRKNLSYHRYFWVVCWDRFSRSFKNHTRCPPTRTRTWPRWQWFWWFYLCCIWSHHCTSWMQTCITSPSISSVGRSDKTFYLWGGSPLFLWIFSRRDFAASNNMVTKSQLSHEEACQWRKSPTSPLVQTDLPSPLSNRWDLDQPLLRPDYIRQTKCSQSPPWYQQIASRTCVWIVEKMVKYSSTSIKTI